VAKRRIPVSVIVIRDARETARFDSATETWTVTDAAGRTEAARAVIDTRPSRDRAVAVHGLPNYFRIPGPDVQRQARYVDRCLAVLERSGCARMEAKSRITIRRWRPQRVAGRFYLTGSAPGDGDLYDGPALVALDGREIDVHARLSGHLNAIDGQYHWRGTLAGDVHLDALKGQRTVQVSIGNRSAAGRIVERTPWGGHIVTGSGAPPYPIVT
jgi:Domain of unknown function (DUF4873)